MKKELQQFLLKLSRQALEFCFATGNVLEIDSASSADGLHLELKEKRGTFVTLSKNGLLRGCIGHIEPLQEIYKDVIENSLLAAFGDARFSPLKKEELDSVEIEISVLTEPKELIYSDTEDLLKKISELKSGVIIKKGKKSATYLPQVWEDFADAEDFLFSLCEKAELDGEEYKTGKLEVLIYQAEVFGE
jgi:AmmeMemoRadiSam system protein A